MTGLERDQNVRIRRADDAAGVIAQIDGGVGDADVLERAAEFTRGNFADNRLADPVGEALGFLNAGAGGGPQVQQELAGIHAGEKIPAQRLRQQPRGRAEH